MKKSACVVMLCAAVLALSLPSAALAADVSHFRGKSAVTDFYSFDPNTCITVSGYIFASENRYQDPPGPATPTASASVSFYQWNECTYETLACVSGSVTLPDGFQVNGNLGSATLNTTIAGYDCLTGEPASVSVAVTWTGDGEATQNRYHSQYSYPGYRAMYRFNGQTRNATVSGSVTFGGTTSALENSYGYLAVANSGTFYSYN